MSTDPAIDPSPSSDERVPGPPRSRPDHSATAIVHGAAGLDLIGAEIADGLARTRERCTVVAVIDNGPQDPESGAAPGRPPSRIPVCRDLDHVLTRLGYVPDYFIYGIAPATGMLSNEERRLVLEAVTLGMSIVNGLHLLADERPGSAGASGPRKLNVHDLRRPRAAADLRVFTGRLAEVACPRIAVLGTDRAIGKRTTAAVLTGALNASGFKAVLVGTGPVSLIQGARYGVVLDSIPARFCLGELEAAVLEAFTAEAPDVIIIEGQGALSHPALPGSSLIVRGTQPDAVILQHAPYRLHRHGSPNLSMPSPATEIRLIETFSGAEVIGLTINHEGMTDDEVSATISHYERVLGIPVTDALTRSPLRLVRMVLAAFPTLKIPEHSAAPC